MPHAFVNWLGISMSLLLPLTALRADDGPTIESNIRYRIGRGDLGNPADIEPALATSQRTLRIEYGVEQLLQRCLDDPPIGKKIHFCFASRSLIRDHPLAAANDRVRACTWSSIRGRKL